jgi:hypothetical protein
VLCRCGLGSSRERRKRGDLGDSASGGEWGERARAHGREFRCVLRDGLSQARLRSSISASHPGLAERPYLYEVGSAEVVRPRLPNNK